MRKWEKSRERRFDAEQARRKIRQYCAYQDRCRSEVRRKLRQLGLPGPEVPAWLEALEDEGWLDEQRFAVSYARGKFFNNRWGRLRIARELASRQVPEALVQRGLAEIPEADYRRGLETVLRKYLARRADEAPALRFRKAADHAYRRGFEPERIRAVLNEVFSANLP